MISNAEIALILADDLQAWGGAGRVCLYGAVPEGPLGETRIVIHTGERKRGRFWETVPACLHLCVPDVDGLADLVRLQALEAACAERYARYRVGRAADGSRYRFRLGARATPVADTLLLCHYARLDIVFEILNVQH